MNDVPGVPDAITQQVSAAVEAWILWLPGWAPATHRGRARVCRKCQGSPVLLAAGLVGDVPHQVAHAMSIRIQRIVDRAVDEFVEATLPSLHAELTGEQMWHAGGFDPGADLPPEFDGLDFDPETDDGQPYLFTMAELQEQSRPAPPLPRPPLSVEEKQRLREEIDIADQHAEDVGRRVCFALAAHRPHIQTAVKRYVEPQIQELLNELSRHLEYPS